MIAFIILLTFSILIHSEPLLISQWNEADCEGPHQKCICFLYPVVTLTTHPNLMKLGLIHTGIG